MVFKFTPPQNRYDLTQIILGESITTNPLDLVPVASSTIVGTFPEWITSYNYPTSVDTNYYAIKWAYTNGGYSDWSSPLMVGRTGSDKNYVIINSPTTNSLYIVTPVSGDTVSAVTSWLEYNKEYYITIDKSLSGVTTLPMLEDYILTFTSEYCPLFSSINDVRYEVGDFINNLTDDTINRIIYKNSNYILTRYYNAIGTFPANYTCDGTLLNQSFRRYVLCKTALDAITAIQLSGGGKVSKSIGDVKFDYSGTDASKDPANKKNDLKNCIDSSLNIILSGKGFQIGVRGKYFAPMQHPMSDPTYGRLSLPNHDYTYNMQSMFDQTVNAGLSPDSGIL